MAIWSQRAIVINHTKPSASVRRNPFRTTSELRHGWLSCRLTTLKIFTDINQVFRWVLENNIMFSGGRNSTLPLGKKRRNYITRLVPDGSRTGRNSREMRQKSGNYDVGWPHLWKTRQRNCQISEGDARMGVEIFSNERSKASDDIFQSTCSHPVGIPVCVSKMIGVLVGLVTNLHVKAVPSWNDRLARIFKLNPLRSRDAVGDIREDNRNARGPRLSNLPQPVKARPWEDPGTCLERCNKPERLQKK